MTTRDTLHSLVDDLPEHELGAARRFLEFLRTTPDDTLLQALLNAREDDEPETPEEAEGMAGAYEDVREGRMVSHDEVRRQLLGQP